MKLPPLLSIFLTPDKHTVTFAIRGIVSMAMALFIALMLDLDRPYWALISAIFLQNRPESGLVIEKGLCQIVGTLIGGVFGIIVLNFFSNYPTLAIASLAIWVGINSAFSTIVRHINFIYAFAMAAITPCIIVLLVMANPDTADSYTIFYIAQARVSEIIIGALCATFVSLIVWPVKITDQIKKQTRSVINQTLNYLTLELDLSSKQAERYKQLNNILDELSNVSNDSSAIRFEGPEGQGRVRATNLLCNKVLSLLAVCRIFGRLQRDHPQLMTPTLTNVVNKLKTSFAKIASAENYADSYKLAQTLRRELIAFRNDNSSLTSIDARMSKTASELADELVVLLRAFNALENTDKTLLKSAKIKIYKDPILGLIKGGRSALFFLIGAGLWIFTASEAMLMFMITPVIFSIMLARLPFEQLTYVLKRMLIGVAIVIPVAIFYALNLLAQSGSNFEILILVLAGPYFIGLMALANQKTLPYGLGFCVPFTILVHPSNDMLYSYSIDNAISNGLAIFLGIGVLYWFFKLITEPSVNFMKARLIKSISRDLIQLPFHKQPEDWFNARMADRLLRMSTYDYGSSAYSDQITDLGLTGLNLGHVAMRLRRTLTSISKHELNESLNQWQQALAEAFLLCGNGETNLGFRNKCHQLLAELKKDHLTNEQLAMVAGMFERLALTFERTAIKIRTHNLPQATSDDTAKTDLA